MLNETLLFFLLDTLRCRCIYHGHHHIPIYWSSILCIVSIAKMVH